MSHLVIQWQMLVSPSCWRVYLYSRWCRIYYVVYNALITLACICREPHLIPYYFCPLLKRRMNNLKILVSFHTFLSSEPCLYCCTKLPQIFSFFSHRSTGGSANTYKVKITYTKADKLLQFWHFKKNSAQAYGNSLFQMCQCRRTSISL